MFKQIALLLLLSLIVIFFLKELAYVVHYIIYWHNLVMAGMSKIFAGGNTGLIIRNASALVLLPLIIALIPAGIYRLAAHKEFYYFPHLLWVSWIILATILIIK